MLFARKIPGIKENWSVLSGEHNGNPMIVRRNDGISIIAGKGYLNFRSGISYEFRIQTENGQQSTDEEAKIYEIEDKIFASFDNNEDSVVSLIITTGGFKEYVIYHNKQCRFPEKLEAIQSLFGEYRLTRYTEEDKKWGLYAQFK